jgi:hypothetical protein
MVTKRKLEELRKTAKAHGRDVAIGPHGAVHTVPVPNLRGGVMAKKRKQGRKKRLSLFRTDVRAKIVDRDLLMQHLINIRHPAFIATLRKIVPEWSPSMPWPLSSSLKIPFDTTVDAGVWKIAIDVKDIKACELAASWLRHMIDLHHGPVAVNRIFAENLFSKESLAHVRSTGQCNTACSLSAGVWKPKVFRGR